MATLLMIKEKLKMIYADYSKIIRPTAKAIIAFMMLLAINDKIGYMGKLDSFVIVLGLTVVCAFLPAGFTVCAGLAVVLLHLYALSLEIALVAFLIFLVMILLYLRFCQKDLILVVLVPLAFHFGIPYVMPLAVGILCGPLAALTVGCGIVIHYYLEYIAENALVIQGISAEGTIEKIRLGIDGIIKNDGMLLTVICFLAATWIVYILSRQAIEHAWSIAIFTGAMANVILSFMGILVFDNGPKVFGLLIGTVIAIPIAMVIGFLFRGADYSRTEKVQFEDDEYYYYVKAVPKMSIQPAAKTVKKINSQKYHTYRE